MLDFIIDILTANYAPEAALADGGFIFLLILFIATTVISHVLTPKPETQDQKPAALGDIKFPTASEGRALPIPFGTTKIVGPNTLWYGNYGYQSIWTQVQGGDNYVGEYRYYFGMQIGLCRGPLDGISRISLGENQVLVETASGFISGVGLDNGYAFDLDDVGLTYTNSPNDGLDGRFRFYAGTETQNANPYLASHVGPVNTAAANFQFGIEEETTGNYWIRNTATEEKFGFGERIDQSIDVLVGDVIVIGEVNRLDNGVLVTPGAAYNGLNGEIAWRTSSGQTRTKTGRAAGVTRRTSTRWSAWSTGTLGLRRSCRPAGTSPSWRPTPTDAATRTRCSVSTKCSRTVPGVPVS